MQAASAARDGLLCTEVKIGISQARGHGPVQAGVPGQLASVRRGSCSA